MPATAPVVETNPETVQRTRLAPLHRVIIHNDDVTPMDFVVTVLVRIFALGWLHATKVMFEAHTTGAAHVVTEPLERAEFHVDQAHSLARGRGWPLSFSIEPEE